MLFKFSNHVANKDENCVMLFIISDIVSNIINSFADLKEKRLENQSLYNFSLGQSSIKRLDGGIYNGSLALNFTVKQI